jgi:hypothetical protein
MTLWSLYVHSHLEIVVDGPSASGDLVREEFLGVITDTVNRVTNVELLLLQEAICFRHVLALADCLVGGVVDQYVFFVTISIASSDQNLCGTNLVRHCIHFGQHLLLLIAQVDDGPGVLFHVVNFMESIVVIVCVSTEDVDVLLVEEAERMAIPCYFHVRHWSPLVGVQIVLLATLQFIVTVVTASDVDFVIRLSINSTKVVSFTDHRSKLNKIVFVLVIFKQLVEDTALMTTDT